MGNTSHSGLEVLPHTGPEALFPQPDANKFFIGPGEPKPHTIDPQDRPSPSNTSHRVPKKALWAFALISVTCLAVGLGAGLGAGLAIQKRPKAAT